MLAHKSPFIIMSTKLNFKKEKLPNKYQTLSPGEPLPITERISASNEISLMTTFIDPNYISGLMQSDGSFFIILAKTDKSLLKLAINPVISITLEKSSINTLHTIRSYFSGCGHIVKTEPKNAVE